jgi:hypothetical protein
MGRFKAKLELFAIWGWTQDLSGPELGVDGGELCVGKDGTEME